MSYRVKEIRKEKGYTQEELAKKAKVARGIIVRLESGKDFSTSTETLNKIAIALECQVTDIFLPEVSYM